MPDDHRAAKTIDKTRRGGLPVISTPEQPTIQTGNGNRCVGCEEVIGIAEQEYFINLRGVALLLFHEPCYNAWVTFRR